MINYNYRRIVNDVENIETNHKSILDDVVQPRALMRLEGSKCYSFVATASSDD